MFRALRSHALPHRCLAVLAAALVLALNVLAVSPLAHAWLHGHAASGSGCSCPHDSPPPAAEPLCATPDAAASAHVGVTPAASVPGGDEGGCIVSLFSAGHAGAVLAPVAVPGPRVFVFGGLALPPALIFAAAAHRLPPGCGPPV